MYWAYENPHEILEKKVNALGIMAWVAANIQGVLGPYFFERNVNADSFLELLHELYVALSTDERFAERQILFR